MSFTDEDRKLTFHPQNILLSFLLLSLTMLFLALTISYVYSRVQNGIPPIQLPLLFVFNSTLLIASSFSLHRAKGAFLKDQTQNYQRLLLLTLGLSLCFLIGQYFAWMSLYAANIAINHSTTAAYVYAISILHLVHVVGGIPFLAVFTFNAYTKMKEPISVLVYFSDSMKRLQLKLLMKYWHFLDILWIYLVLFFYLNYLIQ